MMANEERVTGTRDLGMFNVIEGQVCTILDEFFYNGEGWFKLKNEDGEIFESPDIFWED